MSAPFGIEFFAPLSNFEVVQEYGQLKYEIVAPKPHPLFSSYIVQATPSLGVVWIKGNGDFKSTDAFGNALRAEVDRVAEQLKLTYGLGKKTDFLLSGSIWNEPQYWLNALADGQRYYSYMWEQGKVRELPADLQSIYVGAAAGGGDQANVSVEYASSKSSAAEREVEAELADLL